MQERKKSVALRYEKDKDNAPVVTAVGQGVVAEKIVDLAQQHGVPVTENKGLAQALMDRGVGVEIPAELYQVVAEVFVYIAQIDKKYKK